MNLDLMLYGRRRRRFHPKHVEAGMKDHLLPITLTCPACDAKLDGALNATGDRLPRDGDPSLCIYCRALIVHSGTPVNSLRYPTPEEQRAFLADPEIQHAIWALGQLHQQRGPIR